MTTDTNEEFEAESFESEEQEQEQEAPAEQYITKDDFNSFKSDMISMFQGQGATKTEAKKEAQKMTPEQAEAFRQNPEMMIEHFNAKLEQSNKSVHQKVETDKWDRKAYEDFPALQKDKKFKEMVKSEIQNLAHYGDMDKESPRLLYIAAQVASSKYTNKSGGKKVVSSESAMSPRGAGKGSSPTKLDKEMEQQTQILRMNGWSEEKIKARLKKYDTSKDVHTSKESGRTRRKIRL